MFAQTSSDGSSGHESKNAELVIMYANGYMFFTCAYCAEISEVMNTHLR
jgi:hypothetical protein